MQTPSRQSALAPQGARAQGSCTGSREAVLIIEAKLEMSPNLFESTDFSRLFVTILTFRLRETIFEGISGVAVRTCAGWCMIEDLAFGHKAAGAWTGITAFFAHAGEDARAFGVDGAFWTTVRRTSDVISAA